MKFSAMSRDRGRWVMPSVAITTALLFSALLSRPAPAATPMAFEMNQGQTDPEVRFLARGRGYTLFLTPRQCVLSLKGKGELLPAVLRMDLRGANPQPELESSEPLEGRANYFIGTDPKLWQTGIQTFGKIVYHEVYPGIDLIYYGQQGQLEFDFALRPGAVPESIRLHFEGAEELQLDAAGGLVVKLGGKSLMWPKPLIYQFVQGARKEIQGDYVLREYRQVGFRVSAYDRSSPLVIDPVLVYSTYLGGNNFDGAAGLALDRSGNVYVTGQTLSLNFPARNPYHLAYGSNDVFVTKLNSSGTALVYSTYIGGNGDDFPAGIAVDTSGNAYVTGQTTSTNFPSVNAFQSSLGGVGSPDAFLFKLGPTGTTLLYSTYFGGRDVDLSNAIAVDSSGNAYVTGLTLSGTNFPTRTPFQNRPGGLADAFVAKFNPADSASGSLIYSSWLGGRDPDIGYAIAVDASGNAYVAGAVFSLDNVTSSFPVLNALQPKYGGDNNDVFVAKINASGTAPLWATFLGGDGEESGFGIALDTSNNVYVTGQTRSTNFPTTLNAFQPSVASSVDSGLFDAFVSKISSDGANLYYSTCFGGQGDEKGAAIAVDSSGQVYLAGSTDSAFDFPVTTSADQYFYNGGNSDAFVAKLDPAVPGPSGLIYSSFWGGSGQDLGIGDAGTGIAVDTNSNFYICGVSDSMDMMTSSGAFQRDFGGGMGDGFVAKFFSTNLVRGFADMAIGQIATPSAVYVGSNITYTISITNNGPSAASHILVTSVFSPTASFVTASLDTPGDYYFLNNSSNALVFEVLTNLAVNASATFSLVVTPLDPGLITNRAAVVAFEVDLASSNNTVISTTRVDPLLSISPIPNQICNEDTSTGPIAFVITDADGPPDDLSVIALSSNRSLVSDASFTYGGSGTNRVLAILPLTNQFGTSTIFVWVFHLGGADAITQFLLTVNPVNDLPTLNPISNVSLLTNSVSHLVNLTGITPGPTNEIQSLAVTAKSSQTNLIANPTVIYTSPNSTGALLLTHLPNVTGTSTVAVTIQDSGGTANGGQNTATQTFLVTVDALPAVRIAGTNNNVVVSWSTNTPGFRLERQSNLANPTNWITVTNAPAISGDQNAITNGVSDGNNFFRLRKP